MAGICGIIQQRTLQLQHNKPKQFRNTAAGTFTSASNTKRGQVSATLLCVLPANTGWEGTFEGLNETSEGLLVTSNEAPTK